MPEERFYPTAVSFYFSVSVGNSANHADAAFRDVAGLVAEMDTETYLEGGENTMVYRLPKAMRYQNLVLSRGVAAKSSPLVRWCVETLEGGLARPVRTQDLMVSLLSPAGQEADARPLHAWAVINAYPVLWRAERFDAEKSEVAIEKIEFAFTHFYRV